MVDAQTELYEVNTKVSSRPHPDTFRSNHRAHLKDLLFSICRSRRTSPTLEVFKHNRSTTTPLIRKPTRIDETSRAAGRPRTS